MNAKYGHFLRTFALICATILHFQPLLPVYRSSQYPTRPARSTIPRRKAQQAKLEQQKTLVEPVSLEEEKETGPVVAAAEKDLQEAKKAEIAETEAQKSAETHATLAQPTGFWSNAYTIITQLTLASLSAAVGVAVASGTKKAIKQFEHRREFKKVAKETLDDINKFYKDASEEEKMTKLKSIFAANKIDYDAENKHSTVSYILGEIASTVLLTVTINTFAKIAEYSTLIPLQSMMPRGK